MLTIDNQTLNKYSVRAEKLTEAVEKKATETIKKYGLGYASDSWNALTDYLLQKRLRASVYPMTANIKFFLKSTRISARLMRTGS